MTTRDSKALSSSLPAISGRLREVEKEMTTALVLGALWNPEAFNFRDAVYRWRNELEAALRDLAPVPEKEP